MHGSSMCISIYDFLLTANIKKNIDKVKKI